MNKWVSDGAYMSNHSVYPIIINHNIILYNKKTTLDHKSNTHGVKNNN